MDKDRVAAAFFIAHLSNGLHKWQRFDIADRAADLDYLHVGLMFVRQLRTAALISSVMCGMTWIVLPR